MSAATMTASKTNFTTPQAILWGGLIAGVLDATDGVVAFGLYGMNPIQVLQYIASGTLGPAAFQGGLATAGLGALLHFVIAFGAAATYVLVSKQWIALTKQAELLGLLFGVAVYFFMNYLVLPFSSVVPGPTSWALFVNGVVGHALFVGLPIALYARKAA